MRNHTLTQIIAIMNEIPYKQIKLMSDSAIAKQIGAFVKHHRVEQNKTQELLAQEAGISRSTLSLLERGEVVTIATLIQVLRVLDKLEVLEAFTVSQQLSPLMLAKAEQKKRLRVRNPQSTKNNIDDDIDW